MPSRLKIASTTILTPPCALPTYGFCHPPDRCQLWLLPPAQALKKDPEERPGARRLLAHPWVRQHLNWEPPLEGMDGGEWLDPVPDADAAYYMAYLGKDVEEAVVGDVSGSTGSHQL